MSSSRRPHRRSSILKRQSVGPGGDDGGSGDIKVGFVDGKVVGAGGEGAGAYDTARISRRVSFSQTNEIKEYEKSNSSTEGSLLKTDFNQTMCESADMSVCESEHSEEGQPSNPSNFNLGLTLRSTVDMSLYMDRTVVLDKSNSSSGRKSSSHEATSYQPKDMDTSMWMNVEMEEEVAQEVAPVHHEITSYQPGEMSTTNVQENVTLGVTINQPGNMSMTIPHIQNDREEVSDPGRPHGLTMYQPGDMSLVHPQDHRRRKSVAHNSTINQPGDMSVVDVHDRQRRESVPRHNASVYHSRDMSIVNDQDRQALDMSLVNENDRENVSTPHSTSSYKQRDMSVMNASGHERKSVPRQDSDFTNYQVGDMSVAIAKNKRGRKSVTIVHGTTIFQPGDMSIVDAQDNNCGIEPSSHGETIYLPGEMEMSMMPAEDNRRNETGRQDFTVCRPEEMSVVEANDYQRRKSAPRHDMTTYQSGEMSMVEKEDSRGRQSVPRHESTLSLYQLREMSIVKPEKDNRKNKSIARHDSTIYHPGNMSIVNPQDKLGRKSVPRLDSTAYQPGEMDMSVMNVQDDCTKENDLHGLTTYQARDMSMINPQEPVPHGVTICETGEMSIMIDAEVDREKDRVAHGLTIHQPRDMSMTDFQENGPGQEPVLPQVSSVDQPRNVATMKHHTAEAYSNSNPNYHSIPPPVVSTRSNGNGKPMQFEKPTRDVVRDPLRHHKKPSDFEKINFGTFGNAKTPKRNKIPERVSHATAPPTTQLQETQNNLQGKGRRVEDVRKISFGIQTSPWLNSTAKSSAAKNVQEIGLNCTIGDHLSPQPRVNKSAAASTTEYGTNTSPLMITSVLTTAGKTTHCTTVAGSDVSVILKEASGSPIPSLMSFQSTSTMSISKENKMPKELPNPSFPTSAMAIEINETAAEQLRETATAHEMTLNMTIDQNERESDTTNINITNISKSLWGNSVSEIDPEHQKKGEPVPASDLNGSIASNLTPAPSPNPSPLNKGPNCALVDNDIDTSYVATSNTTSVKTSTVKNAKGLEVQPNTSFEKEAEVSQQSLSSSIRDAENQSAHENEEKESSIHGVTINQTGDMSIMNSQGQSDNDSSLSFSHDAAGAKADPDLVITPRVIERSYVAPLEKVVRVDAEAENEVPTKAKDVRVSLSPIAPVAVTSSSNRPNELTIRMGNMTNEVLNISMKSEMPETPEGYVPVPETPMTNVIPVTPMVEQTLVTPKENQSPGKPAMREIPETPASALEVSIVSDVLQETNIVDNTQANLTLGNMDKDADMSQSDWSDSVQYENQKTREFSQNFSIQTRPITSSLRKEKDGCSSFEIVERKISTFQRTCDPYDVGAEINFVESLTEDLMYMPGKDWEKVAKQYEELLSKDFIAAINMKRNRPNVFKIFRKV